MTRTHTHPVDNIDVDALASTYSAPEPRLTDELVDARRDAFAAIVDDVRSRFPAGGPYHVDVVADGDGVLVRTVLGDYVYRVNAFGVVTVETFDTAGTMLRTETGGARGWRVSHLR